MSIRRVAGALFVALACLAIPTTAHAQSAIAGVVKDTSGAVLPGVSVEASSEVLIEKSKTVVTDGAGQYKIVDLRPGTYVVTFTLPGFQTLRRENVELPSEFTATINGDLKVGALEESVTVSAASPVVDVSTAVHTQILNREAIDAIPTGRSIQGMGQLVVGINLNLPDTGGARAMQQTYMSTHGMTSANNTVTVDGMTVNGLQLDGQVQSYFNDAMNQEVSYQTSGINAETSSGGVRLNMIPREGGNRFSGDFKMAMRPGDWQGSNLTDRHVAAGLGVGNHTDRIIDLTAAEGGPIKKDKLWFFMSSRYFSVNNFIANTFMDDGSQGIDDQYIRDILARVTWQISPRNKFSAYFDEVDKYRGHDMQSLEDPETAAVQWFSPAYHTTTAKWTSPVTNRIMAEAGFSSNLEYYTNSYQDGVEQPRFSTDWFASASRTDTDLGGRYKAASLQSTESPARYNMQGAVSYVTGSHNIKVGMQYQWGTYYHTRDANADLTQSYRGNTTGKPFVTADTVTVRNTPISSYGERLNYDIGIFAQDSWTMKRLTINGGIRYEALNAQVLAADAPAGRFVPARHFDAIENLPNWRNWSPRFSSVFDLFGTSKTALKYSLNKYSQARTTGIAGAYNPMLSVTQSLTWRDVNGDDIAQGERGCAFGTAGVVGCEINFANLPANFGTAALATYGNYPRTWNLENGIELQHELFPRVSVTGSYFFGAFHNLTTTINQSRQFSGDPTQNPNYTPMQIFNPVTGEAITVYSQTAASAGLPTLNLDTFDPNRERKYQAFNLEFRARPGHGATIFGGMSMERQRDVNCTAPDNPNSLRFCDDMQNGIPFSKGVKLAGSMPIKYGVVFSAAFQSNQGPNSARTMAVTRNSTRYPASCPAPCPAGQVILPATFNPATLTVSLVPTGTTFNERITQLDFKVSKNFKINRVTIAPTFEVFNVNNSDAIISYVSTSVLNAAAPAGNATPATASFLKPNSIMQPRMIGIGLQTRW